MNVVIGTIASGEKVDADVKSELHKFLKLHCNHALAVEMEGYGFLESCRQHQDVHGLLVRGISDLVENKDGVERLGSQPYASENAAAFTFALIQQLYSTEIAKRVPSADEGKQLVAVACDLYPTGIKELDVWARAGGRVADVAVSPNGRTQWMEAVRWMRNGGRGATLVGLLDVMLEDFPAHPEVILLRG